MNSLTRVTAARWPNAIPQPSTPSPPARSRTNPTPSGPWKPPAQPAMLCSPMVAPRRCLSAACTVPAVSAELSRYMATFQSTMAIAARTTETPVVHPVASESPAAPTIAQSTTRPRPYFCAVSFPVMETATPARLAAVNRTAGDGIHPGVPSRAAVAARKVTAQPRKAAISQVCTV